MINPMVAAPTSTSPWPRTFGIVGGLGPHAHIEMERRLLKAAEPIASEQDYPSWVVASFPSTPDRTSALLTGGPSPVPALLRGLEALAPTADFAVIACITAHAFLDDLLPRSPLPILSLVEATLEEAVAGFGDNVRVGLLATDGTIRGRLFPTAAEEMFPGLRVLSLLDLPGGERYQEDWVMTPIYGPMKNGRRVGGRLKSGASIDPETGVSLAELLRRGVSRLTEEGADVVLTACTEIGMALGSGPQLLDPLDVGARAALAVSRGQRPLPP